MAVKDNVEVRTRPPVGPSVVLSRSLRAQSTIASKKIVIYSKSYCPYCRRAKQLIQSDFADAETVIVECVLAMCAAWAPR
jgi:hypothetical protein